MRSWSVITVAILLAAMWGSQPLLARNEGASPAASKEIALAELPREARQTLQAIKRGGPFAFERDGVVFGNYERRLPARERGYYREYTVPTPGDRHRGARRIVGGAHAEYYYSDDHYRTFRRIRE
ncbi:MAG: ribonuclease domain-containing protein [Betaproteobacteria bacterium]